jgi:von Willebrand factor A domain-containing protein 7
MRPMQSLLIVASLTAVSPAAAFEPNDGGHLGITAEALAPMGFSEEAINEVADSNRNVDVLEFHVEEAHFDNESLDAASARLIELKAQAIELLSQTPPDGEEARDRLGAALHTLQDFYSHSNWIELGMSAVEASLGRELLTPLAAGATTCPSSAEVLDPALADTTTGYFLLPNPCEVPAGKCLHGFQIFCDGINKDAPDRTGYPEAYAMAVAATQDYVAQILDDPLISGNASALDAF